MIYTDENGKRYEAVEDDSASDGKVFIRPVAMRWRAERGGRYFYISIRLDISENAETGHPIDNELYAAGNYFETKRAAEAAAAAIRELLDYIQDNDTDWNGFSVTDKAFEAWKHIDNPTEEQTT